MPFPYAGGLESCWVHTGRIGPPYVHMEDCCGGSIRGEQRGFPPRLASAREASQVAHERVTETICLGFGQARDGEGVESDPGGEQATERDPCWVWLPGFILDQDSAALIRRCSRPKSIR